MFHLADDVLQLVKESPPQRRLLVVFNAGSSSIKLGIFGISNSNTAYIIGRGKVVLSERLAYVELERNPTAKNGPAILPRRRFRPNDFADRLISQVQTDFDGRVVAIGHRIVHGGTLFSGPVKVDRRVLRQLESLRTLAPLHLPLNLKPIEDLIHTFPKLDQVATFDTAFHRDLPFTAYSYGIPRALTRKGIRRFGFHGLSYEYICGRLKMLDLNAWHRSTIIAHLGSGASLCAVRGGQSLATTMGFSVLDGLLMATRPGSLDPGVLLYLLKEETLSVSTLEQFLYHDCGLLGASGGLSADLRILHQSKNPAAKEAVELFACRVIEGIAAMAANAGGIDAIIFTGGIGENDHRMRQKIADGCSWLGLKFSREANKQGQTQLHHSGSRIKAWMIPTDEEGVIAAHTCSTLYE